MFQLVVLALVLLEELALGVRGVGRPPAKRPRVCGTLPKEIEQRGFDRAKAECHDGGVVLEFVPGTKPIDFHSSDAEHDNDKPANVIAGGKVKTPAQLKTKEFIEGSDPDTTQCTFRSGCRDFHRYYYEGCDVLLFQIRTVSEDRSVCSSSENFFVDITEERNRAFLIKYRKSMQISVTKFRHEFRKFRVTNLPDAFKAVFSKGPPAPLEARAEMAAFETEARKVQRRSGGADWSLASHSALNRDIKLRSRLQEKADAIAKREKSKTPHQIQQDREEKKTRQIYENRLKDYFTDLQYCSKYVKRVSVERLRAEADRAWAAFAKWDSDPATWIGTVGKHCRLGRASKYL